MQCFFVFVGFVVLNVVLLVVIYVFWFLSFIFYGSSSKNSNPVVSLQEQLQGLKWRAQHSQMHTGSLESIDASWKYEEKWWIYIYICLYIYIYIVLILQIEFNWSVCCFLVTYQENHENCFQHLRNTWFLSDVCNWIPSISFRPPTAMISPGDKLTTKT